MFRTFLHRGVSVALVLLLALSFTTPAAAAPVEEGPVQAVWGEIWEWVASLWEGEGDRGLEIDPDGRPTGERGLEIDPDGAVSMERGPGLDPNG